MKPWIKTFRAISNPSGDLEFPWSGEQHTLPHGTHIVQQLWPGNEKLADVALEKFACTDGVKVVTEDFEVAARPKSVALVEALDKTAREAKQRAANAKAAAEADAAGAKAAAEADAAYLAKKEKAKKKEG
jgi:hypothetical protein